ADTRYDGYIQIGRMNDAGAAPGEARLLDGSYTAVLYDPSSGWSNLNDLLPPGSGWDLRYAYMISNNRMVVGRGMHDGRDVEYRLDLKTNEIVDMRGTYIDDIAAYNAPTNFLVPYGVNARGHVAGTEWYGGANA